MMKKFLAVLIICFIGAGVTYMVVHIVKAKRQAAIDDVNKQQLPSFTFFDLDGKKKGSEIVDDGKPVIVIYFNNDCEHCQNEAQQLNKAMQLFEGTQIIMVSFNNAADIRKYAAAYGLNKHPEVTFLMDKDYKFTHWFGSCSIPSVFVYNSRHSLVKEFYGEVKPEAIKKLI